MKVTENSTVGEVLAKFSNGQEILGGFGLHCFGCPMSQQETIGEAATAHGIELDFMLEKLNTDLEENKK